MNQPYIFKKRAMLAVLGLGLLSVPAVAQDAKLLARANLLAEQVEPSVVAWRRHFHEHPELSNREVETGQRIAAELKKMGIEVETGVAKTGVVGILKGGKPGPVVALRADIDGLPVTERADIPFASKAKG
ncbi:MAG: amidohydrolase, partial [Pontibacter sp.]|nr:amidohydrolase [Pontibacter sp.]